MRSKLYARLREDWDGQFFRSFLRLAGPIVIQNLVSSSLFIVDNLMIGMLGEAELAAVAQANQLSMLINIFIFGIASGSAIFAAQFWGKKDERGIGSVLGLTLLVALGVGALGGSVALFFPERFLRLYSHDEKVLTLAAQYLRVVFPSYLILGVTNCFASVDKSTEHVRLPMVASIISICVNTFLNYCLIFGNLGFPRLALRGGAAASVTACTVECVILVAGTFLRRYPAAAILHMRPPTLAFARRFFKTTIPVILNEGLWGLGTTVHSMVYGVMGTATVAAVSIAGTMDRFMYIFIVGVVHASSIMVGRLIGEGDEKAAYLCGRRALTWGVAIGVVSALVILTVRAPLVSLFNVGEATAATAMNLIVVLACALPLRAFNYINIVGVLRSGGDTVASMLLDTGSIWLCAVPLVAIAGVGLHLPILAVYPLVFAEDIPKFILGFRRFVSKKWIHNLVAHSGLEDRPSI